MTNAPDAPRPALRIGEWVALAASIVTVAMTVITAMTKQAIDRTQQALEIRRTELDEAKERVERYKFALTALTGLNSKDSTDRAIALGAARLALDSSESERLFAGFVRTGDTVLRELGRRGAAQQAAAERVDRSEALAAERRGYASLIGGDLQRAALEFEASERAYPTFHQTYELARLARRQLRAGAPGPEFYKQVLDSLALFATEQERTALRARIRPS